MPIEKGNNLRQPVPGYYRPNPPWVCSGVRLATGRIKGSPGVLGGLIVTASDDTGTADVVIYDSNSENLAGKEQRARVTITSTVSKHQSSGGAPTLPGIECEEGIYLVIVSGAVEVLVYYR